MDNHPISIIFTSFLLSGWKNILKTLYKNITMNNGLVPLMTSQLCTHRLGVKCVQANACTCRAANYPCTSGYPSENYRNRGPTRALTVPTLTTNVRKNAEEAQEGAPTFYHATPSLVFHQDAPEFSPGVLLGGEEWPALPTRAYTAHTAPALTKAAAPDSAAPASIGIRKRNSTRARQTDGETASPSPPANQDSDVMSNDKYWR